MLVPGFAASHLYRYGPGSDRGEKIWLSQLDIAWSGIEDLDTDVEISPATLDRVRPASPLLEYYQPFLGFLAQHGIPTYLFAYDWRADVATNGQRLADTLALQVGRGAEFTVIAHSMGGLVAASAMNRLNDATVPVVERLITCGTPWKGSYGTVELFTGQHDILQTIVNLNRVFSRRSRFQFMQQAVRVVASWPGAYDLLPMPEMMLEYPPGPGQDFRTDPFFSLVNPWFDATKYTQAVARRPIHTGFPANITHHNFRGVGRETYGPMPTVREGHPDYYFRALFGDSTVPEFSSRAPTPFNATDRQFDVDHEQFLNDPHVMLAVGRIMGFL
jgi:pimeloyl-ACP methyl ester carboxylesterase